MGTEAPAAAPGTAARGAMRYVLLISAVAATGGFLFGYDTAVVNGTVGALERHFRADPGRLGFALAAAGPWVTNCLVTLTFPGLARAGLGWAYGLYTAAAAASLLVVARFVRETKGRALEDM